MDKVIMKNVLSLLTMAWELLDKYSQADFTDSLEMLDEVIIHIKDGIVEE